MILALDKSLVQKLPVFGHNEGKVDSKYIKEVKSTQLCLGRKAIIDENYIREMVIALRGFSSIVTKLVIENVYKVSCTISQLNSNVQSFNDRYDK
jgi:hypothetical protein